MKIKLIATDMDGTFLNKKGAVSEKNRAAVQRAIEAGIIVVPASGRVLNTLPENITSLPGIKYLLTCNGAAIYEAGKKAPIYENLLTPNKVAEVIECLADLDNITEVYINGESYYDEKYLARFGEYPTMTDNFRIYYTTIKNPVPDLLSYIKAHEGGIEKMNIPWMKLEKREEALRRLKNVSGIAITHSFVDNIEVNREGVHKGDGLKGLCDVLHISPEEVMAFGDSYNDLEMLEFAGFPVAMENAIEPVKKIAKFITKSNDEDGVAYAIEKFCL